MEKCEGCCLPGGAFGSGNTSPSSSSTNPREPAMHTVCARPGDGLARLLRTELSTMEVRPIHRTPDRHLVDREGGSEGGRGGEGESAGEWEKVPVRVMANTPTSSVGPKRFLWQRSRRYPVLVVAPSEPSKYSTTSTRCSRRRGPAI